MKPIFTRISRVTILSFLAVFTFKSLSAQCPGGELQGSTAFDTTIATPAGINTLQIKFPQFDPQGGMLTCVRLCVTITGVIDSVSVENNSASPQVADVYYIRTDQITGPGLGSPLSNSVNQHYGPINLAPTDGTLGSGPDFVYIKDTVLNAHEVCRQISDSATIAQFYGTDSVAYSYNITAFTNVSVTGGNYNNTVVTSAFVNFRFEYCTCPSQVLPGNIREFNVVKLTADKAELRWSGFDDQFADYFYEAEMSRDGINFSTVGTFPRNSGTNNPYRMSYQAATHDASGLYFFRIKQVYSSGNVRYSNIRQVQLEKSDFPKFSLYPNPSDGIVGIKFDNILTGHFNIQIFNAQGQTVVKKEIAAGGSSYVQVAKLETGVYWLRITDKNSQLYSVNQLLIK
jgi:hypothetical protein